MNSQEQARFNPLFESMQRTLKLQGKAKTTQDSYSRAVRRAAERFERCPDDLSAEELRAHFAELLESHSWSTVKLDRCVLQFFYRYVLERPWDWVAIVKPPRAQRLPDVLTRGETHRLLGSVYKLRYRVFFVTLYSTGLRLNEGLRLQTGDIDRHRMRIHVRVGKGNKDRSVPITAALLRMLRQWWKTHERPRLVFPNPSGGAERMRVAVAPMHAEPCAPPWPTVASVCALPRIACVICFRPTCWNWAWICASSRRYSVMSVPPRRHAMPISPK